MTRRQAYAVAEGIVGPVGKINAPIDMLPAITDALIKVQEETVIECWMLVQDYLPSGRTKVAVKLSIQKEFEGVVLP